MDKFQKWIDEMKHGSVNNNFEVDCLKGIDIIVKDIERIENISKLCCATFEADFFSKIFRIYRAHCNIYEFYFVCNELDVILYTLEQEVNQHWYLKIYNKGSHILYFEGCSIQTFEINTLKNNSYIQDYTQFTYLIEYLPTIISLNSIIRSKLIPIRIDICYYHVLNNLDFKNQYYFLAKKIVQKVSKEELDTNVKIYYDQIVKLRNELFGTVNMELKLYLMSDIVGLVCYFIV